MRSGFLIVSLLASKIFGHLEASPYSCLAILERLSPFWTTYVLKTGAAGAGAGAVEELPLLAERPSRHSLEETGKNDEANRQHVSQGL